MKIDFNNTYYRDLLQNKKEMIIDANLLLLYIVGSFNIDTIINKRFTKTNGFNKDEYNLLMYIIDKAKKIIVTPNILTEVCNHSEKINNSLKFDYYQLFKKLYNNFEEKLVLTKEAFNFNKVHDFGISDSIIISLVEKYKYLLVTTDAPLADYLRNKKIDVIKWIEIKLPLL